MKMTVIGKSSHLLEVLVKPTVNISGSTLEESLRNRLKFVSDQNGCCTTDLQDQADKDIIWLFVKRVGLLLDLIRVEIDQRYDKSETEVLSLKETETVLEAVVFLVMWGIQPYLLVVVPASRHRLQKDDQELVKKSFDKTTPLQRHRRLCACTALLHSLCDNVELGAKLRLVLMPYLMASLLQLSFAPLKNCSILSKPSVIKSWKEISIMFDMCDDDLAQDNNVEAESVVGEMLSDRKYVNSVYHSVIDTTSFPCIYKALLSLLTSTPNKTLTAQKRSTLPRWFKEGCGSALSRVVQRPDGVWNLLQFVVTESVDATDARRRWNAISIALSALPKDSSSSSDYYATLGSQLHQAYIRCSALPINVSNRSVYISLCLDSVETVFEREPFIVAKTFFQLLLGSLFCRYNLATSTEDHTHDREYDLKYSLEFLNTFIQNSSLLNESLPLVLGILFFHSLWNLFMAQLRNKRKKIKEEFSFDLNVLLSRIPTNLGVDLVLLSVFNVQLPDVNGFPRSAELFDYDHALDYSDSEKLEEEAEIVSSCIEELLKSNKEFVFSLLNAFLEYLQCCLSKLESYERNVKTSKSSKIIEVLNSVDDITANTSAKARTSKQMDDSLLKRENIEDLEKTASKLLLITDRLLIVVEHTIQAEMVAGSERCSDQCVFVFAQLLFYSLKRQCRVDGQQHEASSVDVLEDNLSSVISFFQVFEDRINRLPHSFLIKFLHVIRTIQQTHQNVVVCQKALEIVSWNIEHYKKTNEEQTPEVKNDDSRRASLITMLGKFAPLFGFTDLNVCSVIKEEEDPVVEADDKEKSGHTIRSSLFVALKGPSVFGKLECFDEVFLALSHPEVAVRAHAFVQLRKLLLSRDAGTLLKLKRVSEMCIDACAADSKNTDSAIFLPAIQCLVAVVQIDPDTYLPMLVTRMTESELMEESADFKLLLRQAVLYCLENLGDMLPKYRDILVTSLLLGAGDGNESIRASSVATLGHLCGHLGYASQRHFQQILMCMEGLLSGDECVYVRRAAASAMEQMLAVMGADHLTTFLSDDLVHVLRIVRRHFFTATDDVVKGHLELALRHLDEAAKKLLLSPASSTTIHNIII